MIRDKYPDGEMIILEFEVNNFKNRKEKEVLLLK